MTTKRRKPQDLTSRDRVHYNKELAKLLARIKRLEARVKKIGKK